ncbi:Hypothetical predicted protein [Octopus vulgaris]|uniref:Uncharacterized protein n=1 Tax=Octopus vulgaris TaxID=6645 RepID=A0AA36F3L0_OCTVU|nr:Hypothetical predicted protein [Octopus vulgaris]
MNTTESYVFSKCYKNLCSETEKLANHSQYPDVLYEGLHKTTELNEGEDFTEENTGHIDSRDDDRENNTENHIGDVMETIQIDVMEDQNNNQLNDDDETAKHDYSKDEKTKRCVCEVADDKNMYVNNKLECKTLNGEKDVCRDKHPVKLNKRSAELDNFSPKEDEENFATNKKYIIKGGKISSISRINPHRINTATERIQNSKTNLTCSFYIPKRSRQEQPENNDGISSTRRPFEECQNFTTHEQHLSIPKPYPHRMSSCEYRLSVVDMSYYRSERKTNYPHRRISESKVSAPLRCWSVSYLQNNNNSASPKSKQGLSRSQQYSQLRDSLDIVNYEIDGLRKALKNRGSHVTSQPHTSRYVSEYHHNVGPPHVHKTALRVDIRPPRYVSDYDINVEPFQPASRPSESLEHTRSHQQHSPRYISEYFHPVKPLRKRGAPLKIERLHPRYISECFHTVKPLRKRGAALKIDRRPPRYVSDYHIHVEPSNSKHDCSRSQLYSQLGDLKLTRSQWEAIVRRLRSTEQPHSSRYVLDHDINVEPSNSKHDRSRSQLYSQLGDLKLTRSQWEAIVRRLRSTEQPHSSRYVLDHDINVEPSNSKHDRSRSQLYSQLGDLKLTRSQWEAIVRRLRSTEQPHSSRYVPDYHIHVEPSNSKHDRSRSQQYSQLGDLKFTRSQWEAIARRLRSTEQPDYDINVEPFQPSSRPPESLEDTRSHQLHSPELSYLHRDSLERIASNVRHPISSSHNRAGRRIFKKAATKLRDKVHSIFGKKRTWAPDTSFHPRRSSLPKSTDPAVLKTFKRIN